MKYLKKNILDRQAHTIAIIGINIKKIEGVLNVGIEFTSSGIKETELKDAIGSAIQSVINDAQEKSQNLNEIKA